MLCKRCAAVIEDGEKICIHCGANQDYVDNPDIIDQENSNRKPPLSLGDYFLTFFVGGIPVIGLVFLIIRCFMTEKKEGAKRLSKSFLIWSLVVFMICACVFIFLCYAAMQSSDLTSTSSY